MAESFAGLPEGHAPALPMPLDAVKPAAESGTAESKFWEDLEENLKKRKYYGRWIAYTVEGCLYVAERHEDDQAVHRHCRDKSLKPDQYFVGRVVPDQPTADITDNWYQA